MKKMIFLLILFFVVSPVAHAQLEVFTVLKGLDPVELVAGREVPGLPSLSVTRVRYVYLFSNEANKKTFESAPDRYQIQLGGGCGRMGSLSGVGDPNRFHVFDGRIYIFASEQCRNSFKASPENHTESPDAPPTGSAEERKQGERLIALALKGFGGANQVDGVKTYRATIRLAYRQGEKVDEYKQIQTIAFPDRFRDEYDWRSSMTADVLRPDVAVSSDKSGSWTRESPVRAALEQALYRQPLVILKARTRAGFTAFAAGKGKVGDQEVDLLKVGYKGATSVLSIDPSSGRILQIAYRGRMNAFGDVVRTFSDFQTVQGLILPCKLEESFNGKALKSPERTVESVAINQPVSENLFRRP
jgi:YHS domain-containing protein